MVLLLLQRATENVSFQRSSETLSSLSSPWSGFKSRPRH